VAKFPLNRWRMQRRGSMPARVAVFFNRRSMAKGVSGNTNDPGHICCSAINPRGTIIGSLLAVLGRPGAERCNLDAAV
jgi:hypothetical protein